MREAWVNRVPLITLNKSEGRRQKVLRKARQRKRDDIVQISDLRIQKKKKKRVSRPEGEELAREKVGGKRLKSTGRKASGEEKTTF